MIVIKDMIALPLIIIPFMLDIIIFSKDKDSLIPLSIFVLGIVIYRILYFKEIGAVIMILGFLLTLFTDKEYYSGRLSFITKSTNPVFIKQYNKLINNIKTKLEPITQHKIIVNVFYLIYSIFWLLILIYVILTMNLNTGSLILALLIIIGSFIVGYIISN